MNRGVLWTILVVTSLIGLVDLAKINSTTPKTKVKPTTAKADLTLRIFSGTRKVITTRLGSDGNPEQQCECTIYYLCDKENLIETSTTGERIDCDSDMVCCAIPLLFLESTDFPSSLSNEPTLTPSSPPYDPTPAPSSPPYDPTPATSLSPYEPTPTSSNQNPVFQSGLDTGPSTCVCVPFYQCGHDDPLSLTAGAGIIEPKLGCSSPNVCCSPSNLNLSISEPPPTSGSTPPPPTPLTPPQTPVVIPSPTPPYIPPVIDNPNPTSDPCECGRRKADVLNRITGLAAETETRFGEFPWMALILTSVTAPDGSKTNNHFVCGASIISPKIVLTAAHCVSDVNINEIKVRAGEYNTLDSAVENAPYQEREVSSISIHPKYNSKVLFNDLALLTVPEPFNFTDHIFSICIPLMNTQWAAPNLYDPNSCVATGWGKNAFDGVHQTTLKKVDLSIIPRDRCLNELRLTRLGQFFQLDTSFICAGGKPGSDTCRGDGGGPLVCALKSDPNRYIQVGVVSWGIGCGDAVPGVYASLEANMEWISQEYNVMTVFRRLT